MTTFKKLTPLVLFLTIPTVLYAAPATIKALFILIAEIANTAIPVLVAIALLVFFWGVSKLILYADNEQKRREGINTIIWGLIALFVIVSVWGIVFVFTQTFFGTDTPNFGDVPSECGGGPFC